LAGKAFIAEIRSRLEHEARSFALKGTFLVADKQVPLNKNGTPYLALVLKDRDGTINAKMWDNVEETERREAFGAGDFVHVECEAQTYRGQPQLKIKKLTKAPTPGSESLSEFLGSATHSPQKMLHEVRELLAQLEHAGLRAVLLARLDDPTFVDRLCAAPAAKTFHHAHLGGLLEHSLSVMKLACALCQHYPQLDRDLLLAGAFLHDLGKLRELEVEPTFAYTDEGNLIGHLVIGVEMLNGWLAGRDDIDATLRLKLGHLILSHHGRKEFGSPVVPKFPEALALHYLDSLDSQLQIMFDVADQETGQRWSTYQPQFDSYLFLGGVGPAAAKPATTDGVARPERKDPEAGLTHRPMADLERLRSADQAGESSASDTSGSCGERSRE
jgi:3'-5' exoribonuclease